MEISIISPVYNTGKYLKRCIESVLSQSFEDFEFLLVDDGSTDDSRDICMDYARRDSRIRVLVNDRKGVSSARNKGIRESKGKYIIFIDSDDAITTDACEKLISGREGVDFVVSFCNLISTDGEIILPNVPGYKGDMKSFFLNIETYLVGAYLRGPWAKLYNKNILIENNIYFPEIMDLAEDFYFVLQYMKHIETICVLPVPTYNYFIRKGSLSQGIFREDSFEIGLSLNKLLQEVYMQHTNMDGQELIYKYDRETYMVYLHTFTCCKENGSAINALKSATANERTHKAFECGPKLSGNAEKFTGFCLKKGYFHLLCLGWRVYVWLIRSGLLLLKRLVNKCQ